MDVSRLDALIARAEADLVRATGRGPLCTEREASAAWIAYVTGGVDGRADVLDA